MIALFYVHVFVSLGHQLYSLFYLVRQLHHVCRVEAEEDVQDFRQLASQFRSHTLSCKSEVLCHLMERKQLLPPAQFAIFKR